MGDAMDYEEYGHGSPWKSKQTGSKQKRRPQRRTEEWSAHGNPNGSVRTSRSLQCWRPKHESAAAASTPAADPMDTCSGPALMSQATVTQDREDRAKADQVKKGKAWSTWSSESRASPPATWAASPHTQGSAQEPSQPPSSMQWAARTPPRSTRQAGQRAASPALHANAPSAMCCYSPYSCYSGTSPGGLDARPDCPSRSSPAWHSPTWTAGTLQREESTRGADGVSAAAVAARSRAYMHIYLPYLICGYLQVAVNVALILFISYMAFAFVVSVRADVDNKVEEYSAEILKEIAMCSHNFMENRCLPDTRLPAMKVTCATWEACMNRDPRLVGRTKLSAETLAEIVNGFVEPISYKTMVFLTMFTFGFMALSNMGFTLARRWSLQAITNLTPQPAQSLQEPEMRRLAH